MTGVYEVGAIAESREGDALHEGVQGSLLYRERERRRRRKGVGSMHS